MGVVLVDILRRNNWNQIGMLVDSDQCGIDLLPIINAALQKATDIYVADTVNVVGNDSDQIGAGLQQLQKSSRSKCTCL